MSKIFARLKEPSTWAGLGMLAAVFGVPEVQIDAVAGAAASLCAVVAVFMPEGQTK